MIRDKFVIYILLIAGLVLFFVFGFNKVLQLSVIPAVIGSYLLWSYTHHKKHQTLSTETILEYTAVALIVILLILSSLN
jgi:hypothetical protein